MSTNEANRLGPYLNNAVASVITRVLQITVLLWVNQHLLRRIDPAEYSLFPLIVSLMYFAELVKHMAIGGLGRFIVEADATGDTDGVTRIVSSMFPVALGTSLLILLAGGMTTWKLGSVLDIAPAYLRQAQLMFVLLLVSLAIEVAAAPFAEGPYVRQRFVELNLLELACEAIRIVILLALVIGVSASVLWLVLASSLAGWISVAVRIALTRRWVPAMRVQADCFCSATAGRILRFSAWSGIQGITGLVSSTVPAVMLNRFGSALDVASFHLGRLPEMHIRNLAAVASTPARPALTRVYAIEGESALHQIYYRGGRYHLWITLLPTVPFLAFAPEIIRLYAGQQYSAAPAVIVALLGAYPFLWASAMFFQLAHAMGKIRAYYVCDTVIQIVTFAAMFYAVAVLRLGAAGAGLAMGLTAAILHVLLVWPMGLRLVNGSWRTFIVDTVVRGMLPFAAAAALAAGIRCFFSVDSWLQIGAAAAAISGFYVLILLAFCLDPFDRSLLAKLSARLRKAVPPTEAVRA